MDIQEKAIKAHREWKGKIEVTSKVSVNNTTELSIAYTPGVAQPCEISSDKNKVYDYTSKWDLVAVVTDGSAVLGLAI